MMRQSLKIRLEKRLRIGVALEDEDVVVDEVEEGQAVDGVVVGAGEVDEASKLLLLVVRGMGSGILDRRKKSAVKSRPA
jgi:hypothetical protein